MSEKTKTPQQLLKGFFKSDVKITNNPFVKSAQWTSQFHPKFPMGKFKVKWVAVENFDKSQIVLQFSTDAQSSTFFAYKSIQHSGNFEASVFKVYCDQISAGG